MISTESREETEPLLISEWTEQSKTIQTKSYNSNLQKNKLKLNLDNYDNWDFKNLNMIFGTDSQPFITFVTKTGAILTTGTKMNMPLLNHQSVTRISKENLLFSGGVNHIFNYVADETYLYNIKTCTKTDLSYLINRRFFAQLVFVMGRVMIIGGRDYGNDIIAILKSCEEYDFQENKWKSIGDLNYSRCNFSSLVYQNKVYVFGGLSRDSTLISHIENYNFFKRRWEVIGLKLSEGLLGGLSFVKNNDILILGGSRDRGNGLVTKMNLEHGADIGTVETLILNKKNSLSKAMCLNEHVLVLGGFFVNQVLIDVQNFKVVEELRKINQYSNIIAHMENLCVQSFRLTKCSFVFPFDNSGNKLQKLNNFF